MMISKITVCFGAGKSGVFYARSATIIGKPIDFFVDNDPSKWGNKCEGINVFPPDYLGGFLNDNIEIIVTVNKRAGLTDVLVQLSKQGFKNIIAHPLQMEKCAEEYMRNNFANVKSLDLGNSPCLKYYVESANKQRFFIRISALSQYESRKKESKLMDILLKKGVTVPKILEIGKLESCIFARSEWISAESENLETALPLLAPKDQYLLGIQSGQNLKKIHSITFSDMNESLDKISLWSVDDAKIRYKDSGSRTRDNDIIFDYLDRNKHVIKNRPSVLVHGDYNINNQMLCEGNRLAIVDFDKICFADPLSDMGKVMFGVVVSKEFVKGQINGYFDNSPPKEAWAYIAYYTMMSAANYVLRTVNSPAQIKEMYRERNSLVLNWFDGMKNNAPVFMLS